MSTAAGLIGTVVGAVFLLIVLLTSRPEKGSREAKFVNTTETEIRDLDVLASLCLLAGDSSFVVKTFRQSGNPHQDDRIFSDSRQATKAAISTFKRSKIEFIVIMTNTESELSFRRPWHDHRGSSEGKKVGWIEIHRIP